MVYLAKQCLTNRGVERYSSRYVTKINMHLKMIVTRKPTQHCTLHSVRTKYVRSDLHIHKCPKTPKKSNLLFRILADVIEDTLVSYIQFLKSYKLSTFHGNENAK